MLLPPLPNVIPFFPSSIPPSLSISPSHISINLYLFFPYIFSEELLVGFSSNFEQVREDSGPLALTLQSSLAASQPFTVHLNSRLLPAGDTAATGECSVC